MSSGPQGNYKESLRKENENKTKQRISEAGRNLTCVHLQEA